VRRHGAAAAHPEVFVFKRSIAVLGVLLCTSIMATPSLAKSKKVTKPTPHRRVLMNQGYFTIRKGLAPGHAYRIQVRSTAHVRVVAQGNEDYTWVANHTFGEASRSVHFTVTAPGQYTLTQPVPQKINGWMLVMSFTDAKHRPLAVQVKDLGRRR